MAEQLKVLTALTKVLRSVLNSIIGDLKLPVNPTKRIKYPSIIYGYIYSLIPVHMQKQTHTHTYRNFEK